MSTPLDAYRQANVVLTGRLLSLQKSKEQPDYHEGVDGLESATIRIERVFKGSLKVDQEVPFWQGGGADCIWSFDTDDVGREFLFYASGPVETFPLGGGKTDSGPKYLSSNCGRTKPLKLAADDLAFLTNVPLNSVRSRVSGVVKALKSENAFPNLDIQIKGTHKTYHSRTNSDGFFEIYGLPAGNYTLRLKLSPGADAEPSYTKWYSSEAFDYARQTGQQVTIPFTLKVKGHASLDLKLKTSN